MLVSLIWILNACGLHPPPAPTVGPPVPTSSVAPTSSPSPTPTPTLAPTLTPLPVIATPQPSQVPCQLLSITAPTLPAVIPNANQLDETTGLHMTGTVQQIDLAEYSLKISGLVDHPLELRLDDMRCMPKVTATTSIRCGFFSDTTTWSGVPLTYIFKKAGIQPDAANIELYSADGYMAQVSLEEALQGENFLAYEWQGEPLPILHGFPLRAIFPLIRGSASVKWLVEIRVR